MYCRPAILLAISAVLVCPSGAFSQAFTKIPQQAPAQAASPAQASISLSPAIVLAQGAFGQSLSQTLTITNQTPQEFAFEMVAQDVVVKDGKREFVAAGETEHSIASSAVFSQKSVIVKPYTSASVDVRFTLPTFTKIRAVVAVFQGTNKIPTSKSSVSMLASLGTLITFNLSDNTNAEATPAKVAPASDAANLSFKQVLTNTGTEPILPDGVVAILDAKGSLVGKSAFPSQRLLPGEKLDYSAEYAEHLDPGDYKAICTFQYGNGKTLTSEAAFNVP